MLGKFCWSKNPWKSPQESQGLWRKGFCKEAALDIKASDCIIIIPNTTEAIVYSCLQVLLYISKLNAGPIGLSVMFMFVIDKNAILSVS